jgi:hypothetical protein
MGNIFTFGFISSIPRNQDVALSSNAGFFDYDTVLQVTKIRTGRISASPSINPSRGEGALKDEGFSALRH